MIKQDFFDFPSQRSSTLFSLCPRVCLGLYDFSTRYDDEVEFISIASAFDKFNIVMPENVNNRDLGPVGNLNYCFFSVGNLELHISFSAQNSLMHASYLHLAAAMGHASIVNKLLKMGAHAEMDCEITGNYRYAAGDESHLPDVADPQFLTQSTFSLPLAPSCHVWACLCHSSSDSSVISFPHSVLSALGCHSSCAFYLCRRTKIDKKSILKWVGALDLATGVEVPKQMFSRVFSSTISSYLGHG